MAASTSTDRIERFFNHLSALKQYARRVLLDGNPLTVGEEGDRQRRMAEFLTLGSSFDLSEKEMVTILFRELFSAA